VAEQRENPVTSIASDLVVASATVVVFGKNQGTLKSGSLLLFYSNEAQV
jgi:hypothetical protein